MDSADALGKFSYYGSNPKVVEFKGTHGIPPNVLPVRSPEEMQEVLEAMEISKQSS
jgi:hypothetical protein